jgi:hypothetical protein
MHWSRLVPKRSFNTSLLDSFSVRGLPRLGQATTDLLFGTDQVFQHWLCVCHARSMYDSCVRRNKSVQKIQFGLGTTLRTSLAPALRTPSFTGGQESLPPPILPAPPRIDAHCVGVPRTTKRMPCFMVIIMLGVFRFLPGTFVAVPVGMISCHGIALLALGLLGEESLPCGHNRVWADHSWLCQRAALS